MEFMQILPSIKAEFLYARDVVKAGVEGATSSGAGAAGLTRASQSALAPAALGAAIGILSIYLGRRGRSGSAAVVGGVVGGALGFTGGVAWSTRQHARACCRNAAHGVQAVRDAHWLEKNPIAYA